MNTDPSGIKLLMTDIFVSVSQQINTMGEKNPDQNGMGCALIATVIAGGLLHTCHVGDVRCYVCSPSGLAQLTNDHTQVADMVRQGIMTREEARNSHRRNILTQSIGQSQYLIPEYQSYSLKGGERILLCSDGLWDMVPDIRIHAIVCQKKNIFTVCTDLNGEANSAGGKDNITVIVFENCDGVFLQLNGDDQLNEGTGK